MADIILIHGTTQSPHGWKLVVDMLEQRRHRCWCVDVTRLAVDASLDAIVDDITDQLPDTLDAPVVVAHSGSGALIPSVADRVDAARQVFVSAWIPDGIHSLIGEHDSDPTAMFHPDWIGKDPGNDPAIATKYLFHDCPPHVETWALTTIRSFHPHTLYHHRMPAPDRSIPAAAIVATRGRALRADWAASAVRRRLGIEPGFVDAGHCPHVSRPDAVVAAITDADQSG